MGVAGASHSMHMSISQLVTLLAAPLEHLSLSLQAARSGQLSLNDADGLRGWLLHQTLVHENRPTDDRRDVFYFVGLENGAFEGFVYSVPEGTPANSDGTRTVSLLFSQRLSGLATPSALDWGDVAPGSTWSSDSVCARGVSCTKMPAETYLADACPTDGSACADAGGCAGSDWTCADAGVRVDYRTDGAYQTNRVPEWYTRQASCTTSDPCLVTIDATMTSAIECQLRCQQDVRCSYFSHQWEVNGDRTFHRCFLKAALPNYASCAQPYTEWTGSSGPKQCPSATPCIGACLDYGAEGGACGTANVVGLVLNKRDWRGDAVRWTAPFDPRTRPWYAQAKEAAQVPVESDTCATGDVTVSATGPLLRWSDIYLFAGDDAGLGISATGVVICRAMGTSCWVFSGSTIACVQSALGC
jgi:hypothetical protein